MTVQSGAITPKIGGALMPKGDRQESLRQRGFGREEKCAIGAVWASWSGDRCLFEMPTDVDFSGVIKAVKPAAHG